MQKTIIFSFIFLFYQGLLFAQTGILNGKITDSETGEELIGASVMVVGTYLGSSADLDGNYSIFRIQAGTVELKCSYISYETQIIKDLEIKEGEISVLNIKLKPVSVGLSEVVVSAKAVRNTENALLTMQKKSAGVLEGISSEEIIKTGDSDAAGAVQRISGVSLEGGKYVYVRGLGDRYSKTTLNGAEIPSLDPERNTVQMDIFPASVIENMVVYKSFTPDLNSFTGGLIDIVTKDFPDNLEVNFGVSLGYNTQASLRNDFLTYEGGKTDWLGYDDGIRSFPVKPKDIPIYPSDRDKLDYTTKSFNKIMEPSSGNSFLNQKYTFSVGNRIDLFGKQLGFDLGMIYKNDLNYFADGKRGIYKLTSACAESLNKEQDFDEQYGNNEILLGFLGNTSFKINESNKVGYILLYNHSGIKRTIYDVGERAEDEIGMIIQSRELGFMERAILSNQLKGEHFIDRMGKMKIDWVVSYTNSSQKEPDLRFFTNSYYPDATGTAQYEINPSKYKVPSRFSRTMEESNLDNKVHFEIPLKYHGYKSKIKYGASYNYKYRDFNESKIDYNTQVQYYNGSVSDYLSDENIGQNNPAYNPVSKENYGLYVQNATDLRNSYFGYENVTGAYIMVDIILFEKLRLVAGVRFESNKMETESKKDGIKKGTLNDNDFLPSINLTYSPVKNMNLRLVYTRTLSRPTFREIAPFASFSPVAPTIVGNPELKRTLVDNFDFKWEYFMKPGEVISLSLFYKHFTDPIEMVDNPVTINPEISFQNVNSAQNYGLELEVSKKLDFTGILGNFSIGLNFAMIKSVVDIDSLELVSIRALDPKASDTRPLFGQAPYILNGRLSYLNQKSGLSANLVFNMTGKRIALVTKGGTPEVYEYPFPKLDFNASKTIGSNFKISVKIKNILNPGKSQSYEYRGKRYPFFKFTTGTLYELGLSYNL